MELTMPTLLPLTCDARDAGAEADEALGALPEWDLTDLYTAPDPAEEARREQARLEAIASARRAFLARVQVQPTPSEAATAAAPAPAATPPEAH